MLCEIFRKDVLSDIETGSRPLETYWKYGIALFVYFSGGFSFYVDSQGWPREVVQDILVCSIWIYVRDTRMHIPTQELCSNELGFFSH